MAPLRPPVRQEVLRVSEVACTPAKFELRPPGCAVRILVDSGPKQSFRITKSGDDGNPKRVTVTETPFIPAGEEYVWEPELPGVYTIQSTIYEHFRSVVTVPVPPSSTCTPKAPRRRGPLSPSSVDDKLVLPLPQQPGSKSGLLKVSKRATPTPSPTAKPSLSPNNTGNASFSLNSYTAASRRSPNPSDSVISSGRSSPATLSARPGSASTDGADEPSKHPSVQGLRRRRGRSSSATASNESQVSTESVEVITEHFAISSVKGVSPSRQVRQPPAVEQAQARRQGDAHDRTTHNASAGTAGAPSSNGNGIGRGCFTEIAPVYGSNVNSLFKQQQPVVVTGPQRDRFKCPRCATSFACEGNQRRCIASHAGGKKGRGRKAPAVDISAVAAFWDGLDADARSQVFAIDEDTDGAMVLSRYEKVRQRGGTRIDPVAKLCAVAGRLADAVGLPGFALRADMTGAVLLNYLQCCTENTFTYDTAAPTPSQLSQATTGGDIVDCSWAVAVLAGRRLLVAYNADRERQAQAACELLQAEAEAERKKQAGGTAQNGGGDGSKANKKGNKKKKKAKEKKAGAGGSGVRPQLDSCMEEAVVEGGVDADDGDSPDAVQIEDSAHSMEMGSAIDSPRAAQADVDATLTGEVVCEGERSEAPTGVISADGELDSDPATTAAEMPNGACEPPNDAACNVEPESEESTESEMAAAAAAGEASVAGADDAKPPLPDPPAERSDRRKGGKKSKGKQRQQVLEPAPVEEPTVVEHSVTVAAEEDKAKPVVTLREEAKPLVPAAEVEAAELVGDAEEPAAVHLPEPETEADVVVESASCTEPSACEAAPAVALSAPDALEPPPSPREAEVDVAELLLENDAPSDSDALSALSDEDAAPAIEPATGDEAAEGREPSEPEHPLPYDLRALKVHPSNYFSALHTPGPLPVHPHLCPVYLYPGIPYDALTLARCGVAIPVSIGCNAPYAQPGVGVSLSTASSTTSAAEPASQEGDPLGQAHAAAPTSVEVLEPTLEEPAPEAAQQAEMEAESAVPEPGRACEMIRPLVEVRELPPPPGQQGFDMDAAIAFFERRSRELNEMLAQYRSTQQASDADVGEDQAVGGFVAEKEPVSGIELQGGAEPDAVPEPVFDVEVQEVAAVELRASAVVANNDGAPQVEEWCGSFDDRERSRHSSRASSLSSGREEGQPSSWQLGGPRRRRHQQYRNGNNGPVTEFGGVDAASERWPSRNDRSKSGGRGRGNGAKVAVRQQSGAPGRSGDWRIQARV